LLQEAQLLLSNRLAVMALYGCVELGEVEDWLPPCAGAGWLGPPVEPAGCEAGA